MTSHCFQVKIQMGWHVRLFVTVLLPTCLISSYLALQSSLHTDNAPVIFNEPLAGHGIFHELSLLSVFVFVPSLPGTFSPNNSLDPTQSFFLPPSFTVSDQHQSLKVLSTVSDFRSFILHRHIPQQTSCISNPALALLLSGLELTY